MTDLLGFVELDEKLADGQSNNTTDKHPLIKWEWDRSILPGIHDKAQRGNYTPHQYRLLWIASWELTTKIFQCLHDNWYEPKKGDEPKYIWAHQKFDLWHLNDPGRGFAIDKATMLEAAASYLQQPEIQSEFFDWLFLDCIVFAELDAYAHHVRSTRGGTGTNWAMVFAPHDPKKFYGLSILFVALSFGFNIVAPLGLAYYLAQNNHENWALGIAGAAVLLFALRLLTYPLRWRRRRKAATLLAHLLDVYDLLGKTTISPRKVKESLDKAAEAGVVLDGAVFGVIDRAMQRDPTALIPHRN